MAPFKDKWVRRFLVNETARHKQGFTIYKVTSVIFLKSSPHTASKVSVWKRYNDFKKLHAALKLLHGTLRIKESFPPFAKPKFFGRFEAEVVEDRRECAVKFLEFVARHAALFMSDVFVKFFESSLSDDCTADCSQSLSSDTSEDDKSTILDETDISQSSVVNGGAVTGNPENNSINDNIMDSADDRQAMSFVNTFLLDSNTGISSGKPPETLNNNNIHKSNEDLSWQQFLSVERLVENGKKDRSQGCETSIIMHDGSDLSDTGQDSGQYILIAAAHMSAGFRHEAIAEYEEAYMQYKLGISNLRQGVQKDPDIARRATIIDKIVKYSERADRLYNRHLNCNISMISKPTSELQYYKVLRVMGSVMLVKDLHQDNTRVIKTVEKPAVIQEDISKYILRGRVPHMVQLHACVQTETTVFLILQYASGGKLWDYLKTHYAIPCGKLSSRKKIHRRSMSCEAIIHLNSERRINTSRDRANGSEASNSGEPKVSPSIEVTELLGTSETLNLSPGESLRKLEEEFGANSIYKKDLPTTQLLEKAQQLLRSVDATIKKSNSIASRLNESGRLLYPTEQSNGSKESDDCDNTEESCDLSELSVSDSFTDFSGDSDKTHDATNHIGNSSIIERLPLPPMNDINRQNTDKSPTSDESEQTESCGESSERMHNDEDSGIEMETELWRVPETILRCWAAQMLLALEALHQQEVVISNLRPDNLLVDEDGKVLLSYVVPRRSPEVSRYHRPYTAPELCMFLAVVPATPAADVWSFGVILYEMFTGIPFQSRHPGPFHSHSIISIPSELSESAKSLLTKILRFEPEERLTIPEIKQLPFFDKVDWLGLLNA